MKEFAIRGRAHGKRSRDTKKFPRHSKLLAVDENTILEKMPMNRPYGYREGYGYPNWNHMERWMLSKCGQNVDSVFSEFRTKIADAQKVRPWRTPKSFFDDFIYYPTRGEGRDKYWNRFTVDNQNRLIQNPDYRNFSWRRRAFPPEVSRIAEHNKEVFKAGKWDEKISGIGPISIGKYYLDFREGLKNIYAFPKTAWEEGKTWKSLWNAVGLSDRYSDFVKSEYEPVDVPGLGISFLKKNAWNSLIHGPLSSSEEDHFRYLFLKKKND